MASCLGLCPLPQVNVWVGPFFVLSGYVAGYTATELGKYEASARVKPAGAYTVARVAGFYPLFALIQVGLAGLWGGRELGQRRGAQDITQSSCGAAAQRATAPCLLTASLRRSCLAPCSPLPTTSTTAPWPPWRTPS